FGPGNAQAVDPPPGLLGGVDHGLVLIQDDRPRLRGGASVARARGAQVGPDPGASSDATAAAPRASTPNPVSAATCPGASGRAHTRWPHSRPPGGTPRSPR